MSAQPDDVKNLIRLALRQRESEHAIRSDFTILCGTFNTGEQLPSTKLTSWLSRHNGAPIPDIIALAFEELKLDDAQNQAYALTDSPVDSPEWITALTDTMREVYENQKFAKVSCVRLVSIMLVIFVREPLDRVTRHIDTAVVPCGLLGRLGNKGGIAVRLKLHDTSICFVASHLSAHLEDNGRRNQDFRTISTKAVFTKLKQPLEIDRHDIVFWMGDLNYRIAGLTPENCKTLIEEGAINDLYRNNDQLYQEMKQGNVFAGYSEGAIKFRPTYKYDPGTDNWDTSRKGRAPAWCDRILWKTNDPFGPVTQVVYRSHPDIMTSDHRPVSAIFTASVRIVDIVKYKQVFRDVKRNKSKERPQAVADQKEIDFGDIKFLESSVIKFNLKNTGTLPLEFVFARTYTHPKTSAPRWLSILPSRGNIGKGESIAIQLTARIDPTIINQIELNVTREFSDGLLIHLVGGTDIFLPVKARLALTCFGLSHNILNSVSSPIGTIGPYVLAQIIDTPPGQLLKGSTVPKELCRLVERLSKPDALEDREVMRVQGILEDKILIRNALDLTHQAEPLPGSIPSAGEALLDFIQAMPTALVPPALQPMCLQVWSSSTLCNAFLETFQTNWPSHYAMFQYIFKYLGKLIRCRSQNKINIQFLAGIFAELAFRPQFSPNDEPSVAVPRLPQEAVNFILRILEKESGLSWKDVNSTENNA